MGIFGKSSKKKSGQKNDKTVSYDDALRVVDQNFSILETWPSDVNEYMGMDFEDFLTIGTLEHRGSD